MRKKRIFGPRRKGERLKFAVSLTVVFAAFYIGYFIGLAQRPVSSAPPPSLAAPLPFPH